jgi:hypothetical protein
LYAFIHMIKIWDTAEIIAMAKDGASASTIKTVLDLPITVRQVQRIVAQHVKRQRERNGRLDQDKLGAQGSAWRSIIEQLLEQRGHNKRKCDLCGKWQPRDCDVHHKKYEGATLDDLCYVCRKCNLAPSNVGLA